MINTGKVYEFELEEVKKHNKYEDAWVVINGRVYDITNFIDAHPGGGMNLFHNYLGKDITNQMQNPNSHEHSPNAYDFLGDFEIGILKGASQKPKSEEALKRERIKNEANIDMNEALISQVGELREKYQEWVHIPQRSTNHVYMLTKGGFIEFNTRTKWWVIPITWLPVALWELSNGLQPDTTFMTILIFLIFGVFGWACFEYFAHRFLFHMNTTTPFWNVIHFFVHGVHHLDPLDPDRLVFPPVTAIMAFYLPLRTFLFFLFNGSESVHIALFSIITNYIIYDLSHYYLHHGSFLFGPFSYLKKCHMHHHFFPNGDQTNFGISPFAKILDFVFDTNYKPKN